MSGSIRLFVRDPLAPGAELVLAPGQAHYLGAVMRRGAGDPVRLFNGRDGEFLARLVAAEAGGRRAAARLGLRVRVEARTRAQAPGPDLWLAFALLKRDATDLVVQKATELGAAALFPLLTARTNAARANLERLEAIAIEAAEQCERLDVPVLHPPRQLAALLAGWPPDRPLFVACERAAAPPPPGLAPDRPAGLLVGPEGGFTEAELDALRACPFVTLAGLGPRILRAETAALAGLVLLQAPPRA